jgi:hypothetical protein
VHPTIIVSPKTVSLKSGERVSQLLTHTPNNLTLSIAEERETNRDTRSKKLTRTIYHKMVGVTRPVVLIKRDIEIRTDSPNLEEITDTVIILKMTSGFM